MRIATMLFLTGLLLGLPAQAQDVEGSQDHPLITRYPGSIIQWYSVENYRPFRLPVGPITGYRHIDEWIDTEGQVTRLYYELNGGERTHSEVYANYKQALESADFELLAEGLFVESSRRPEIGSRAWQEVFFRENPFNKQGPVSAMVSGSASSGGSGSLIARKERAAGTVYVAVSVYQFRSTTVSTLVDVVEVEQAETGLIAVDAEAIGAGIEEAGRVVLDGLLFDFDKATLQPASAPVLDQMAIYLKANPDKQFFVVGHTDAQGELAYNLSLSADRARAVVDALVETHGIARDRLEPHGVGPLVPVFANTSEAGRDRNRRVELVER